MKYGTIREERPDLLKCLLNKEDAVKYSIGTAKKIDWICPNCGKIIPNKSVNKVVSRGVPCFYCGDGVSRPEKIVASALSQAKLKFEYQKMFEWAGRSRYDFFISEANCIIEVNGSQHYGYGFEGLSGFSYEEQIKTDIIKQKKAMENGITSYIIVKAISTLARDIIPELEESLCAIGIFATFDISQCELDASESYVVKAARLWNEGLRAGGICEKLGMSRDTIIRYLKSATDIGLCDYTPKYAHQISQRNAVAKRKTPVICVNTGEIFPSIHDACRKYHISTPSNIIRSCKSTNKHAGVDKNGNLLKWEYFDAKS